jgi:transposase
VKKRVVLVVWAEAEAAFTTKIHAPRRRERPPGPPADLSRQQARRRCRRGPPRWLEPHRVVIADKGYDADRVRSCIRDQGAIPNIPNRSNRKEKFRWKKAIYRKRNHVEQLLHAEAIPPYRHPIRQARRHFSRLHPACRYPHFLAIN